MRPADLSTAVEHALQAPSGAQHPTLALANHRRVIQLHADWNRHLAATHPGNRDLVISCGPRCTTCSPHSRHRGWPSRSTGCLILRTRAIWPP